MSVHPGSWGQVRQRTCLSVRHNCHHVLIGLIWMSNSSPLVFFQFTCRSGCHNCQKTEGAGLSAVAPVGGVEAVEVAAAGSGGACAAAAAAAAAL
eukprot:780390-Pelagomonas_calceolata.AAC.1